MTQIPEAVIEKFGRSNLNRKAQMARKYQRLCQKIGDKCEG